MRVISVVGARPQFVKLAPVHRALVNAGDEHVILHTGQHYDHNMSGAFFSGLGIPEPDLNLEVGSASHGAQTGRMLEGIESALVRNPSDWVLVYGDTNSTVAGALAAAKLGRPVAHLEAGLRSFNRSMPEEINRVATDHLSDLLLAPTQAAAEQLRKEGLAERTVLTGDVMTDLCLQVAAELERKSVRPTWSDPSQPYLLATLHRPSNTDNPVRLAQVLKALESLPIKVVLVVHPRLRGRATMAGIRLEDLAVQLIDPLDYHEMVAAVLSSEGVVTDSGGLQKEAYLLGIPCTTLRSETEWLETTIGGWNVVAENLDQLDVHALRTRPAGQRQAPFGDGLAAPRAVAAMARIAAQR